MTSDDVVFVVGRTTFSKNAKKSFGDLFNQFSLFGSISQNIMLWLLLKR